MESFEINTLEYNELDVLGFIEAFLSEGETLSYEFPKFLDREGFHPDAFLPNGCTKLNIRGETYLEIKQNMPQNVLWYIETVRQLKIHYCLIITKNLGPYYTRLSQSRYKFISFKSFASWIKRYKTVRSGYSVYQNHYSDYQKNTIQRAQNSVDNNKVTLFVGAGLGNSLKLPDWKSLLSNVYSSVSIPINEVDIDEICNNDPLIKAGFLIGDIDNSNVSIIENQLYPPGFQKKTSILLDAIRDLVLFHNDTIESIITYNYDDYIERSLREKGVECESVYRGIRAGRKFPVYHVHGFISSSLGQKSSPRGEIILTEKKYHEVFNKAYSWINVEQYHALSRNTCIFIGTSMTDPNVRRLMDAVLAESSGDSIYVLMSKETSKVPLSIEKQYVFTSTMWNLGAQVIWCDKHVDVPHLLKTIFN